SSLMEGFTRQFPRWKVNGRRPACARPEPFSPCRETSSFSFLMSQYVVIVPMYTTRWPPPVLLTGEAADFSLVLGGPLYQLLRRSHLADDALELVHRRILAGV